MKFENCRPHFPIREIKLFSSHRLHRVGLIPADIIAKGRLRMCSGHRPVKRSQVHVIRFLEAIQIQIQIVFVKHKKNGPRWIYHPHHPRLIALEMRNSFFCRFMARCVLCARCKQDVCKICAKFGTLCADCVQKCSTLLCARQKSVQDF